MAQSAQSKVTLAPDVIRTIVRNTVLAMPGVLAVSDPDRGLGLRNTQRGVQVQLDGQTAKIDLKLVAVIDVALPELGHNIQTAVTEVLSEVADITVTEVNVTFDDVRAA